jgi:hypothetical protein
MPNYDSTMSKEARLDAKIAELIGKIVSTEATDAEYSEYQRLSALRSQLMKPTLSNRIERRRRARAA